MQSNISSHLARLERELGVTLFDRTGGFLTEEGQAVVRRARRVQAELDALDADVAALRDEVTGTVRLGCIGTSARWLVPLVLEAVTAAHPKVHVIVVDATTNSLVPRLLADELDLAVVNLPVANPEVSTEPLFDEDRILIAPDDHPAGRAVERVAFADLGRPRAAARAERHRVPRRARPRGGRRRHRAAAPRPRSTACASSPPSRSRGSAPPSCRPPRRPTGSRGAGGGCPSTGSPGGRWGWPGARAACSRLRPAPCARRSSRWWPPRGPHRGRAPRDVTARARPRRVAAST